MTEVKIIPWESYPKPQKPLYTMKDVKSRAEYEEAIKLGLINPKDVTIVNEQAFVYDDKEIKDAIESAILGLKTEPKLPVAKTGNK